MTTAEYAQLPAEQAAPDLRLPRWAAVRWCAAFLYVASLVAYTAVYGIPVQRELVVSWTCGALVCASIGRPPREILQLVVDWLPIVAVLAVYDFTRGAADSVGIGVHTTPMIDFDRFVFFGQTPSEWLQSHLYDPGAVHWYDVAFTLIYTSYFIVPFALAGVLWARDRLAFLRFAKRLVSLAAAGLATYVALPGGAAVDGGRRGAAERRRTDHRQGLGCPRRRYRRVVLPRPGGRQRSRRRALPALRLRRPGRVLPLAAGATRSAAAAAALPAGDGPDPAGDRRALLLRRLARLALRRRR